MSMPLRITSLTAWTQIDAQDQEGLVAMRGDDGVWLPLIGADLERIESLRPYAQAVAQATGRPVTLRRFGDGEVLETLQP